LIIVPDETRAVRRDEHHDDQENQQRPEQEVRHDFLIATLAERRTGGFLRGRRPGATGGLADFTCHWGKKRVGN